MKTEQKLVGRPINPDLRIKNIIHYPNLKTVLMVEDVLRNSDGYLNKTKIREALGNKIMPQTLNIILAYLEDKKEILITKQGIIWIRNDNPKFLKMLKSMKMLEDYKSPFK